MVAKIIEEPTEEVELDLQEGEELGELEPVESNLDNLTDEAVEQEPTPEEVVPEKYQGKSVSEVIHMHQEAEKAMGRQSTEVGELRRLVDDYVKPTPTIAPEPEEEIDFFDDPNKAVNQAIANNPALKGIQELQVNLQKQELLGKLSTSHPDYMETINDESFATWVKESPIRIKQYQDADGKMDYDAANELLSNWDAQKKIVSQATETAKVDVKAQRKAASTGSSKGTAEAKSRKIYRRSDIMNLMQKDPERYAQLSDEMPSHRWCNRQDIDENYGVSRWHPRGWFSYIPRNAQGWVICAADHLEGR